MSMSIAEWLDAVQEGLGAHAAIFEEYGATIIGHLGTLVDDDIEMLTKQLRQVERPPPPLQVKCRRLYTTDADSTPPLVDLGVRRSTTQQHTLINATPE